MITQTLTDSFKRYLLTGTFNFTTDTFKIALYSGTASLGASTAIYSPSISGQVVGAGYTAGGAILTVNPTPTVSNNVAYVSFNNVSWPNASFTAAGALIYDNSKANLSVAVLNFGGIKSPTAGVFTIQFPIASSTTAIIRIA